MLEDIRYSCRTLLARPVYTATAVVVLAVGVGLHAAVFTLVSGLLFRPLAASDPDRLRFVYLTDPGVPDFASGIRYADYLDLLGTRHDLFSDVLARGADSARLTIDGEPRHVRGEMVTGNYFDVLGVAPLVGRTLRAEDDQPAAAPAVVISAGLWTSRFGSRPGVVGEAVALDARSYTIVGVMPAGFKGTLGAWELAQFWAPLQQRRLDLACRYPTLLDEAGLGLIGRLRPGVTETAAEASLSTVRLRPTRVPAGGAPRNRAWTPTLFRSGQGALPFDVSGRVVSWRLATALMVLSTVVLLIASANVVALGTARGVARRLEFATRAALGASTGRLGRQVMIEMLLLALAGCVGAVFVARGLVFAFAAAVPATLMRFSLGPAVAAQTIAVDAPIDWRVLLYAAGASVAVALIVGLMCARQARRPGLLGTLSSGAVGSQPFSRTIGRLVVIPQLSLCVVLLVVAGVLTRAIVRAESVTPGYDVPALVSIEFTPPAPCRDVLSRQTASSPAYRAARDRFHRAALAAVREVPGVSDASLTSVLPLETPHGGRTWVMARETTNQTGRFQGISAARVSAGYFATLRIPVLKGRGFDAGDERGEAPVVLLSEALARRWWGEANPIGQQVSFTDPESTAPPRWMQVVGIVGDVGSALDPTGANPAAYTPLREGGFARAIVIRSGSASPAWRRDIRRAIAGIDPAFQIGEVVPIEDAIQNYLYPRRLGAQVLAVSAVCGLLLAAIGIYGLVSYAVARRAREIGIRMALGATRGQVLRLVGREALAMALAGSILGTILGYAAVRFTSHTLVPLPSLDAVTLVIVPLALVIAVVAASYLPARRAARTDPLIALRDL